MSEGTRRGRARICTFLVIPPAFQKRTGRPCNYFHAKGDLVCLHNDDVFVDIGEYAVSTMLEENSILNAAGALTGEDHLWLDGNDCAVFNRVSMVCRDKREFGDFDADAMSKESNLVFLVSEKIVAIPHRLGKFDGILKKLLTPPKIIQDALISRIKVLANLDIAEKRLPQDGRIRLIVGGKDIDIRVSICLLYTSPSPRD